MAQQTGISWTDATWNPWHGCKKVSAGCKYCYMFRDKERWKQDPTVVMRSKANFDNPLTWQKQLGAWALMDSFSFIGMKIFTCSWSDFFIEEADEWRAEAWKIIKDTPEFTYQILTKRPERIKAKLPDDWGLGYPNVWLGVSVENNEVAHRIRTLSYVPAVIRFVSFEPLLSDIDLKFAYGLGKFHWAIIGGESGNDDPNSKYKYRPCNMNWICNLITQLDDLDIRIWVKQMGTHIAKQEGMSRHGQEISEWPEVFRIQEFPIVEKNGGFKVQVSPPSNAVEIPLSRGILDDVFEDGEEDDDTEYPGWLCICGHYQADDWHCHNCGHVPPHGCDCSDCKDRNRDPDEDELYYQTVWSKFDHIPAQVPDIADANYVCECGNPLTLKEWEDFNGLCDDCRCA